jgi:hypothetical protein
MLIHCNNIITKSLYMQLQFQKAWNVLSPFRSYLILNDACFSFHIHVATSWIMWPSAPSTIQTDWNLVEDQPQKGY